jgi:hypothetical protein
LTEFWTTAKKPYPNVSGIARLARSNSPTSAFDYLPKVVRQYGCSLPRSAWHDENNCTRRFRKQAALRDHINVAGTGN